VILIRLIISLTLRISIPSTNLYYFSKKTPPSLLFLEEGEKAQRGKEGDNEYPIV